MKTHLLLILAVSFLLAGCSPRPAQWVERIEPTTAAERQAVAATTEKILSATPRTLAGDDQDWDDAIAEARRSAIQIHCRKTLWEWQPYFGRGEFTGRWKYAEEIKP